MSDKTKGILCICVAVVLLMLLLTFHSAGLAVEWLFGFPFVIAVMGAIWYDLKSKIVRFLQRFR
ncbi:hypothetical protein [Sporolactobacillus sp. KGMB 08714]|uniref:hypothetical protein n=1 Tax=Sporolactobacillus sp. KGMB 08714 TaxID=3064704 RepID=UPI002FBEBE7E